MQESHRRVQWVYESTSDKDLEDRYDQWAADYDNDLATEFEWNAPQNATDVFIKHVDKHESPSRAALLFSACA